MTLSYHGPDGELYEIDINGNEVPVKKPKLDLRLSDEEIESYYNNRPPTCPYHRGEALYHIKNTMWRCPKDGNYYTVSKSKNHEAQI